MPTWQEALQKPTLADTRDAILAEVGPFLTSQALGSPDRDVVEGVSRQLVAEGNQRADLAATASVETVQLAGDSWVDAEMSWFDLDSNIEIVPNTDPATYVKGRFQATKAVWLITMIMVSGGPLTIDASNASGIVVQADNGAYYQCTQKSAVLLANGGEGVIEFTARSAGSAGNNQTAAPPFSIRSMVSGPAGLSVSLESIVDHVLAVTARDAETNAAYILRGLGRWALLGAGWVRLAFDYLIPTYSHGAITRWHVDDANPNGPGTVEITAAGPTGPSSSTDVNALEAALNGMPVKPVGSGALTVVAATNHARVITATLQTDGSNAATATRANAAIVALGNAFPIGTSRLPVDLVIDVLMGRNVVGASVIALGAPNGFFLLPDVAALRGFPGVQYLPVLSLTVDEIIGAGEVLVLTTALTVLV